MKLIIIIFIFQFVSPVFCDLIKIEDVYLEYHKKDNKIAIELGKQLVADIGEFQKKLGHYPKLRTKIVIAGDKSEYQEYLSQQEGIQEFSQAIYKRSSNTIYLRNPRDDLRYNELSKILLHEYIHSYVYHYYINAPLWFHEGMAVYFSNDFGHNRELNLVRNYLFGNTKPLSEMQFNYPENRIEWEVFYAKSALAVRYLAQKKSVEFYKLWEEALPYRKFNAAFLRSFKYSPSDYSVFFEEYSKTHFKSEIILAISGMIWLIFPVLFFIGYLNRRQKMKRKMAVMEQIEAEEDYLVKMQKNEVDLEEPEGKIESRGSQNNERI